MMTTSNVLSVETLAHCFLSPEEIPQRFGWGPAAKSDFTSSTAKFDLGKAL